MSELWTILVKLKIKIEVRTAEKIRATYYGNKLYA